MAKIVLFPGLRRRRSTGGPLGSLWGACWPWAGTWTAPGMERASLSRGRARNNARPPTLRCPLAGPLWPNPSPHTRSPLLFLKPICLINIWWILYWMFIFGTRRLMASALPLQSYTTSRCPESCRSVPLALKSLALPEWLKHRVMCILSTRHAGYTRSVPNAMQIHLKITAAIIDIVAVVSPRMILLLVTAGHGGGGGRELPQHVGQEEEEWTEQRCAKVKVCKNKRMQK